jgi:hypothetical protein
MEDFNKRIREWLKAWKKADSLEKRLKRHIETLKTSLQKILNWHKKLQQYYSTYTDSHSSRNIFRLSASSLCSQYLFITNTSVQKRKIELKTFKAGSVSRFD